MAKNKAKKKQPEKRDLNRSLGLSQWQQSGIFIVIIIIYLIVLLKPVVIDGLSPQGVDALAYIGQSNLVNEFQKETGETALWNPAIFSGMPLYQVHSARATSVDNIINQLSSVLSTAYTYYLVGGLGMFLLLLFLKMTPAVSFLSSMSFILLPHYASMYLEGHLAKFRAVMFIPWIILAFLYFLQKRDILSSALFALTFGLQIRTQHYQIVFYTALLILAIGIQPFIQDLIERRYSRFAKSTGLLVVALALGILMAAQPILLAREYLPFSKRGKTTINLQQKASAPVETDQSAGVTIDYATQWSTSPSELLTWFVPRFYGGMSGEKYKGSEYPQLKNRMIPGYWGEMPFTQSYEYMGIITLILAAIGIYANRKNKFILAIISIAAFYIILSFGRHFLVFYELFFDYFPYFNKFRAPMMSVTLTGFLLTVLAAFGLQYMNQIRENISQTDVKNIIRILAGFIGLGIIIWLASLGFSYQKAGQNYEPAVLDMLKNIRETFLHQDLIRYFLLTVLGGGAILAFLKNKLSFTFLIAILIILSLFDLTNVQSRYNKEFIDQDKAGKSYFAKTSTNEFLMSDTETFRILPPPQEINNNRWAYFHQTIGGYTPIKMFTIEEIMENCLTASWDPSFPFNWNVLRILNVKYLVLPQRVAHEKLIPVYADQGGKLYTYLFRDRLPRAYFVGKYRLVEDEYDRLELINSAEFDPADYAILEQNLDQNIEKPDSAFCNLSKFTPNLLEFEVFTDKSALMVISENYYPPGWHIYLDGSEVTAVYKTNHANQSLVVPAGNHRIEVRFEPENYYRNIKIAGISVGIIYLSILFSLFLRYKDPIMSRIKKPSEKSE